MKKYDHGLAILREQLGDIATVLEDRMQVNTWVKSNFPVSITGIIQWQLVPSAKSITLAEFDSAAVKSALENLIQHVGARDEGSVIVLWHDSKPNLMMPLSAARDALDILLNMSADEMYIASLDDGWLMEFDPYYNECDGAKLR